MAASHYRLGHLTALIDNNNMQADGVTAEIMSVEPVVERFTAFGFDTQRIDGHDHDALARALPPPGAAQHRPRAIVLQTVPGKGVAEFERHHKVHYLRLEPAAWSEAIAALG
jgi:transketolase